MNNNQFLSKSIIEKNPIMEQFNSYRDQGLQCSIDNGDAPVPIGARDYLKRHGYLIIKNIYDTKQLYCPVPKQKGKIDIGEENLYKYNHFLKDNQSNNCCLRYNYSQYLTLQAKIRLIVEDIIGEKLHSNNCYDCFHFENHRVFEHSGLNPQEIIVSVQASTNLPTKWPFIIKTFNDEYHSINLENGWAILYFNQEMINWREPFKSNRNKIIQSIESLLLNKNYSYCHQVFFHYLKASH